MKQTKASSSLHEFVLFWFRSQAVPRSRFRGTTTNVRSIYNRGREPTHSSLLQFSILSSMESIRGERSRGPRDGVVVAFRRWFIPNGTFLTNDKFITFAIFVSVR